MAGEMRKYDKHSQVTRCSRLWSKDKQESSFSVICVIQVFVCVVNMTLGVWLAAILPSVVVAVSEPHWLQAITRSENVFGEDGSNPRRGVEAVWKKLVFLFSFSFFFECSWGIKVRLDETDRGAAASCRGGWGVGGICQHGNGCYSKKGFKIKWPWKTMSFISLL